jgi:hypothetical protein
MANPKLAARVAAIVLTFVIHQPNLGANNLRHSLRISHQSDKVAALFSETKTICVGRFVIDVPKEADVIYGPAYMDADLLVIPDGAQRIETIINDEQKVVQEEARFAEAPLKGADSMLGKVVEGSLPGQRILFANDGSGLFYDVRSYVSIGEDLLVAKLSSFPEPHRYSEVISHLTEIGRNASARGESEIPSTHGVCIYRGFIGDIGRFMTERATVGIRLRKFPDVHFSVEVTSKDELVESDALEPRVLAAEMEAKRLGASEWYSKVKFIRRGKRSIGKWDGFEVLARKPKQKVELSSHEFAFVSQGEPKNLFLPVLDLALHTGVRGNEQGSVPPGLSDDEALDIWDRLTNSIRVRPNISPPSGVKRPYR